jgi:hypothetical protein
VVKKSWRGLALVVFWLTSWIGDNIALEQGMEPLQEE